jgi:hypothetical protein
MKFSVDEIILMIGIIQARTRSGHGSFIKDLRLINKIVIKLKKALPPPPVAPETTEGPIGESDEDKIKRESLNLERQTAHQVACTEYPNIQIDPELSVSEINVIKFKFAAFDGFMPDERSREIVLGLADKLDIN